MNLNLRFYWSLLLRRLPVMLALFLVCSGIGIAVSLSRPDTYSATARLSIADAQIDASGARTVQTDQEQLEIIEQRLMTRPNLLDIARRFNVLDNQSDLSPDEIVREMRAATTIRNRSGRSQATLMTVTFRARTGRLAADVVNEYVTLIQEYDTQTTDDLITNRKRFWQQEVDRISQNIDLQSGRIVAFKNENACCLPDDLPNRLDRQNVLQERLSQLDREEALLEKQKADVIRLYETTGLVASQTTPTTPAEQQLAALKLELTQKLAIYSEDSYRIRGLKNQIASLETVVASQVDTTTPEPTTNVTLDIALGEVNSRLETLAQERQTAMDELARLEESIVATSSNAIALDGLEREYQNFQGLYNSAVKELSNAQQAEQVVARSQGQKIDVFENASVPTEPAGPNRLALSAAGIGLGSALAMGYFLLLELLNRTIRRPAEIRSKFGIIPIATVPYLETQRQKFIRRALLLASSIVVLIGVPTLLWYIDQYYRPLDQLMTQVLSKIGLS